MEQATFNDLMKVLSGDQTPKVWSLLVTVFGELGQEPHARVSGALLSQLMEAMGVKPEAMRVALHRLKRDGWIDSRRIGRSSEYYLTDSGRAESAEASPRIYRPCAPAQDAWLVLTDPTAPKAERDLGEIWLTPNILITSRRPCGENAFVTPIDPAEALPTWMVQKLCDPSTLQLSETLAARFSSAYGLLEQAPMPGALERIVLRVLIVHNWRRIVLKAPELPDFVFSAAWRGAECRMRFGELLSLLPKPTLDELQVPHSS